MKSSIVFAFCIVLSGAENIVIFARMQEFFGSRSDGLKGAHKSSKFPSTRNVKARHRACQKQLFSDKAVEGLV